MLCCPDNEIVIWDSLAMRKTQTIVFKATLQKLLNVNLVCMFLSCHVRVSEWIHTL